ncbi:MAG: hypothetical protein AABY22_28835, partial [Nanoarchaeota archaeon]
LESQEFQAARGGNVKNIKEPQPTVQQLHPEDPLREILKNKTDLSQYSTSSIQSTLKAIKSGNFGPIDPDYIKDLERELELRQAKVIPIKLEGEFQPPNLGNLKAFQETAKEEAPDILRKLRGGTQLNMGGIPDDEMIDQAKNVFIKGMSYFSNILGRRLTREEAVTNAYLKQQIRGRLTRQADPKSIQNLVDQLYKHGGYLPADILEGFKARKLNIKFPESGNILNILANKIDDIVKKNDQVALHRLWDEIEQTDPESIIHVIANEKKILANISDVASKNRMREFFKLQRERVGSGLAGYSHLLDSHRVIPEIDALINLPGKNKTYGPRIKAIMDFNMDMDNTKFRIENIGWKYSKESDINMLKAIESGNFSQLNPQEKNVVDLILSQRLDYVRQLDKVGLIKGKTIQAQILNTINELRRASGKTFIQKIPIIGGFKTNVVDELGDFAKGMPTNFNGLIDWYTNYSRSMNRRLNMQKMIDYIKRSDGPLSKLSTQRQKYAELYIDSVMGKPLLPEKFVDEWGRELFGASKLSHNFAKFGQYMVAKIFALNPSPALTSGIFGTWNTFATTKLKSFGPAFLQAGKEVTGAIGKDILTFAKSGGKNVDFKQWNVLRNRMRSLGLDRINEEKILPDTVFDKIGNVLEEVAFSGMNIGEVFTKRLAY